MRLLAPVLLAVSVAAPAVPASAADGPQGASCSYVLTSDPFAQNAYRSGVVFGGPVLAGGTLTCTMQVNSNEHLGTENDAFAVSATGTAAVAVAPTPMAFPVSAWDEVFVCTQFTPTGGDTLYWTGAEWSASALSPCEQPPVCVVECPIEPPYDYDVVDALACTAFLLVQPVLADPAAPASVRYDGDLYVQDQKIWDCPPYGN